MTLLSVMDILSFLPRDMNIPGVGIIAFYQNQPKIRDPVAWTSNGTGAPNLILIFFVVPVVFVHKVFVIPSCVNAT